MSSEVESAEAHQNDKGQSKNTETMWEPPMLLEEIAVNILVEKQEGKGELSC